MKLNSKFYLENRGQAFVKNAMILTCARIQRKILMFDEVRASESSFWDWKLHEYYFVNIRFILNNTRFNKWLKNWVTDIWFFGIWFVSFVEETVQNLRSLFPIETYLKGRGRGVLGVPISTLYYKKKSFLRFPRSIEESLRLRKLKCKNIVIIYTYINFAVIVTLYKTCFTSHKTYLKKLLITI